MRSVLELMRYATLAVSPKTHTHTHTHLLLLFLFDPLAITPAVHTRARLQRVHGEYVSLTLSLSLSLARSLPSPLCRSVIVYVEVSGASWRFRQFSSAHVVQLLALRAPLLKSRRGDGDGDTAASL